MQNLDMNFKRQGYQVARHLTIMKNASALLLALGSAFLINTIAAGFLSKYIQSAFLVGAISSFNSN